MNITRSQVVRSVSIACLLSFSFVLANDICQDAIVVESLPYSSTGDTSAATADFPTPSNTFRNLTCGITTTGRGVWYAISGTNQMLEAKLQDATGTSTKFNTAIFTTNSDIQDCSEDGALTCLLTSQYALLNQRTEPTSQWFAESGVTYFFHVAAVDEIENENDVEPFVLNIKELETPRPNNDRCSTAQDLGMLPANVVGATTVGSWPALLDDDACSIRAAVSRGVYFRFRATNQILGIALNNIDFDGDDGEFEVALLNESCNQCIFAWDFLPHDNDHDLALPSNVTLESDQTYSIFISGAGFSDVATSFDLSLKGIESDSTSSPAFAPLGATNYFLHLMLIASTFFLHWL